MGLLLLEGFDDGLGTARWHTLAGTISSAYGKHGNGLRVGNTLNHYCRFRKSTLTTDDTITIGMYAYFTNIGGGAILHSWNAATSYIDWIVALDASNNRLYVRYAGGGTYYYAPINTAYMNTWYYIELKITIANAPTGAMEVRQDGVTMINLSSIDTLRQVDPLIYFGGYGGEDVNEAYIDDIYITDTAGTLNTGFLSDGPIEVATLLPDGNGNSSGMVGSDADQTDNYLLVDNNAAAPPATTEYVGSATEGDKDTYTMDDLAGAPTVLGVTTSIYASKTDVDAKLMRPVLRSGTTDYVGTSKVLSDGTWSNIEEAWDADPDTAVQWLYGGVNAMEVGQEVRDS